MRTRILTRAELEGLATMGEVVDAVEGAFRAHAEGRTQMPAKVYLSLPEHQGDFRAMPAAMEDVAGFKWVNSHRGNPKKFGIPAVMGVFVLSNPENGLPIAIMDATWLTAVRTGAAAGVASRHLVAPSPSTVGFVGCGVQAHFCLASHRAVFGDGFEALCADLNPEAAEAFAAEIGATGIRARAVSAEEASGADVVNTSTPGTSVAVRAAWVRDGAHVNAMGADAPGKQELETSLLARAQVVIDEHHQATHSGEINVPLSEGAFSESDLAGTIGQVVTGAATIDRARLSVFDSTGLAIQDLAVAKLLAARAEAQGVGHEVDLAGLGR
mgnify:CR=1 FL=1